MSHKKTLIIGALILIVVVAVGFKMMGPSGGTEGRVIVMVSDAATSFATEGVTSLTININNVTLNGEATADATGNAVVNDATNVIPAVTGNADVMGSATLSDTPKVIDLVGLKKLKDMVQAEATSPVELPDVQVPAAQIGGPLSQTAGTITEASIKPGTYKELVLTVSKPMVTTTKGMVNTILPGQTIRIPGNFVVQPGKTTTILVDFNGDKSLHATNGGNNFVVAPVVTAESRTGATTNPATVPSDVSVGSGVSGAMNVSGGEVNARTTAGMDETGQVGPTLTINPDAQLDVLGNNVIRVATNADKGVQTNVTDAIDNAVKSGLLDTPVSVEAMISGGKTFLLLNGTKNGDIVQVLLNGNTSGQAVGIVRNSAGASVKAKNGGASSGGGGISGSAVQEGGVTLPVSTSVDGLLNILTSGL